MSSANAKAKLNKNVLNWKKRTFAKIKKEVKAQGIEHRENSPSPVAASDSLKHSHSSRQGLVRRISYKFPKHMVFVHKGVGRGVPASRAGSSGVNRKPKEWFNPVIEENINELANTLAEDMSDIAMENIFIK